MATKKHDKPIPKITKGKDKTYNPTEKGAGMTAKGRAEYNAKNNANLKPLLEEQPVHGFCLPMAHILHKSSFLRF